MKLTNQTIVISAISLAVGLGLGTVFGVGGSYALRKATTDKTAKTEAAKDNGTTSRSPGIDNTQSKVGKTYTRKEIRDLLFDKPGKSVIETLGQPKKIIEGRADTWVQYWVYENVVVSEVTGRYETLYIEVWDHGRGNSMAFHYSITSLRI